ncbi:MULTISPECIES: MFS transporter [Bacillaceae]|uniref:MFS transporter n=1 Tax=Bacillaceae TaxID=186817 RepID=UPI001C58A176|nr:MFS transporter [Rossellomorea sp. YZS02]MBW3110650.1 MFS transporter [Bacillus sp. MCCB 382]MDX8343372.1 MFS transporter [Rossellomorea sp. YZS02]
MKKMIEIFKNPIFLKLFFANFTSHMGSVIGLTAFMFYLLDRFSEQPMYASVTEMMYSLPTLVVFFLVGVLADRMDRQKIAYHCDTISAFLTLLLFVAIFIGWLPLIFTVLFLRSGVQKFFFPAEQGILQGVLSKDDYSTAAGLNQMVMSLFMLLGNAVAIFVYWTTGIYGAIAVDFVTFVISAILIKKCVIPEEVRLPNGKHSWKDLNIQSVSKDFTEGMKYILNHKLLLSLIGGFVVFGIVNGGFAVIPIFILKYKLAPGSYEEYSILLGIAFGAGVLIGSIFSSMLTQKFKFHVLIVTGLVISGTFIIAASFAPTTWLFLMIIFIAALGLPLVNIAIGGWMPSIIDPKMMGRVQGWINPLMMLSQSITLGVIAMTFPSVITVEMLYWLVGGCLLIVAIFYTIILPKYVKEEEPHSAVLNS